MPNENEPEQAATVLFTPEFKRNIRQLVKKYRRLKADIQPLLDELTQGQTPGDQIPGVQSEIFKVRIGNSDSKKGKSGGYRVIYQHLTNNEIVLITIYSKTEQEDITAQEIRKFILAHEAQQTESTNLEAESETDAKR